LFITNLTILPTFKITENKEVCQGENYLGWTETGTYVQELLATSGCDSIVTTNLVVYELPQKPEIEADGDTLTCSVSGNYFWYRNDSLLKSNNTKSIVIEESGNYKVQVSNEKGCLSGFSESVFVVKTSAGSNYSADIFNIYPNPVSGTSFTVKSTSPDFKTAVIKIYNSAGILIYSDVLEKNKTTIPTSKLAARGLFIVTYQAGSLMEIKKLILN
jgi:hypothetical protein